MGTCPVVSVGGAEVGTVLRAPELDAPDDNAYGFRYEYTVLSDDWGQISLLMDVTILWSDLAGNTALVTLPEQVRFDFVRPEVTSCALFPGKANADANVTYSISTTEPLLVSPPALVVASETPGLFGPDSLKNSSDQSFSWVQSAGGIGYAAYKLQSVLVDQAGNESDGPVCNKNGTLDSLAPAVWPDVKPGYLTSFGLNDEQSEQKDDLKFDFWLFEHAPGPLTADPGPCQGNCPAVLVGGQEVGVVLRKPQNDAAENVWGFRFEYDVDPADWGEIDSELDVVIYWTDDAGNIGEMVLDDSVSFDFIRPQASDCLLVPDPAGASQVINYGFTVSEKLMTAPQLEIMAGGPGLFPAQPEVSGGGFTCKWSGAATKVQGDAVVVSGTLRDESGNWSDGPVCTKSIEVDTQPPDIVDTAITTDPEVLDSQGQPVLAGNHGDLVKVAFTVSDNRAVGEDTPQVQLDTGLPIDFALTSTTPVDEKHVVYTFELALDEALHLGSEGQWPIRVSATDEAGNLRVVDVLALEFVRLDFSPPKAECVLIPAAPAGGFKTGSKITIQVSPYEELDPETMPVLVEDFDPPFDGDYFTYAPPWEYRFVHTVEEGEGEYYAQVKVRMKDLVGNETAAGENGCTTWSLNTLIDGVTPAVQSVAIQDNGGKPYMKGDTLSATIVVDNADLPPSAVIGGGGLQSVGGAQELDNGFHQWTYSRVMEGTETEGPQKLHVTIADGAGNQSDNLGEEPVVVLDFTLPEAQCVVNLDTAKEGDVVRLTATFSEPLDAAGAALDSSLPLELNEELSKTDVMYPKYVFEVPVTGTKQEWTYSIQARDAAGNPKILGDLCGGKAWVDGQSVKVLEHTVTVEYEDPPESGNWLDTGINGKDGSRITATVEASSVISWHRHQGFAMLG